MRILTWNLWWRFGSWEARQDVIAAELARVDPDVVLLQEVWADGERDQAVELAAPNRMQVARTHNLTGTRLGRPHEFGNAVLSRWPVRTLEQVALSGPTGEPSHRSALAVQVDAPTSPIVVVVTHLAWEYDKSELREQQLFEVVALVDRHRSPDPTSPPVILGGDFNAVPESDEIRRLTGLSRPYLPGLVFTDVWDAVGDGPGHTWTRDNPNSDEALWPRRRLDYLFVSWPRAKGFANPVSAELVGVEPRGAVVGSDHYGVMAELDDRPLPETATE